MRETERRIRLYQARLPRIRQKIMAALLVFAVSASVMAVATFSWVTLSIAPETTNIYTAVAANGNLEIALANNSGTEPDPSAVGDSSGELTVRNTKWGNLINLADPAYGLENIVLRPATLNVDDIENTLLEVPLKAAKYYEGDSVEDFIISGVDADGRIYGYDKSFRFTVYDPELKAFVAAEDMTKTSNTSVRAISYGEVTEIPYDNPNVAYLMEIYNTIPGMLTNAGEEYQAIAESDLGSITGLLSTYLQGRIDDTFDDTLCDSNDVVDLYNLMVNFYNGPMTTCGNAYMKMFEMYQMSKWGKGNYEAYTDIDKFCSEIESKIPELGYGTLDECFYGLDIFIDDWNTLSEWLDPTTGGMVELKNRAAATANSVTWGEMKPYVDVMIHYDGTIHPQTGATVNGVKITSISSSTIGDIGLFGTKQAVVNGGIIYNMDARVRNSDGGVSVKGLSITMMGMSMTANASTSAPKAYPTPTQTTALGQVYSNAGAQKTQTTFKAEDTYGYAIDFWVRTNAKDSYLILEGKVLTEERQEYFVIGTDQYPKYRATVVTTTTVPGQETEPVTDNEVQVYLKDNKYYYINDSTEVEYTKTETVEGATITTERKVTSTVAVTKEVVTGYSGVNRIWNSSDDVATMSPNSTSQGAGSCYTFYPSDPTDYAQSLEVLSALRIAFVTVPEQDADNPDAYDGKKPLAVAYLDIEHCYEDHGKVTIPIVLREDATDTGIVDKDGNPVRAITLLEQNEATFICALIYLDGALISNDQVLATSEFQGQLNIQFGSTQRPLESTDDTVLRGETRTVSASLQKAADSGSDNFISVIDFGEDETNHDVIVKIKIQGAEAESVVAHFTRKINENQGTRQPKITFTSDDNVTWYATVPFDKAGEFLLREVIIDGITYSLTEQCSVSIPGFTVGTVFLDKGNNYAYRTADSFVSENLSVSITTGKGVNPPSKVSALFMGDNGVNIVTELKERNDSWSGTVNFLSSGTYTMQYLIIESYLDDGTLDTQTVDIGSVYTRSLSLGLRAKVYITPMDNYSDDEYLDGMTDVYTSKGIEYYYQAPRKYDVSLEILDDKGGTIAGLDQVALYYGTESQRLDANLVWNGKQYVGSINETAANMVHEFEVKGPGTYAFNRVELGVGDNTETISKAISAPSIIVYSKLPVSYSAIRLLSADYLLKTSGASTGQTIAVQFAEAPGAAVYGLFAKTDSKTDTTPEYYVQYAALGDTEDGKTTYTFEIPYEDGYWELIDIKLSGATYNEKMLNGTALGELFDEEKPAGYTMSKDATTLNDWNGVDGYVSVKTLEPNWDTGSFVVGGQYKKIKVVKDIVFTTNLGVAGGVGKEYSGSFMQSHSATGLTATICDFEGEAVSTSNIVAYIQYDGDSQKHGGYTYVDATKLPKPVLSQTSTPDKITYVGDITNLQVAGTYTIWFEAQHLGSTEVTKYILEDAITVKSATPTVKISAQSPAAGASINVDTNGAGSGHTSTTVPAKTDTEATVYFSCTVESDCGVERHNYSRPSVTITLSGIGRGDSATLNFGSDKHVYSGTSRTGSYTWTGDGACARNIGNFTSKAAATDEKTPAGDISVSTLVVAYDGVEYSVSIPTITIHNPY